MHFSNHSIIMSEGLYTTGVFLLIKFKKIKVKHVTTLLQGYSLKVLEQKSHVEMGVIGSIFTPHP